MAKLNSIRGRAPIVEVDQKKMRKFRSREELVMSYQNALRRHKRGEALPEWILAGDYGDLTIPENFGLDGASVLPSKPQ